MPQTAVPLTSDARPAASTVLARAFADDPFMSWLFGRSPIDPARTRWVFDWEIRGARRRGWALTTPEVGAVALWLAPRQWRTPWPEAIGQLPAALWSFNRRMPTVLSAFDRAEKAHPRTPHWYLATIGSDPDHRGTGAGTAVLSAGLARCDAEGMPAYLESSKEANVPYYERHGFEVTGEIAMPSGGPTLWSMWREPRPPGS